MQSSMVLLKIFFLFALLQASIATYNEEKPGICVPPKGEIVCVKPDEECKVDSDCPGVAKCCASDCGLTCQKPPRTKPGQCLFLPFGIVAKCLPTIPECTYDTECPGEQKCCETLCSRTCQDPTPVRPGTCPKVDPSKILCKRFENECRQDNECPSGLKCCKGPCGITCEKPVNNERPGTCPKLTIDPALVRCFRFENECSQDDDCDSGLKCCKSVCGITCQKPVRKNEACPYIDMNQLKRNEEDDRTYLRVEDGNYVWPLRNFLCEKSCSSKSDCADGQSCCKTSCKGGRICYDSEQERIVKPGECRVYDPRLKILCIKNENPCKTDMDCTTNLKCCKGPCGLTCEEPLGKTGNCPAPKPKRSTSMISKNHCETRCSRDSQCDGDLKCCSNGCGTRCMKPEVIVKPGVCRKIFSKIACFDTRDKCKSDGDCSGDEKCCESPCGLACQKPDLDKPGICKQIKRKKARCSKKATDKCKNDQNCPKDKKCCAGPCNLECQAPQLDKPGTCKPLDPRIQFACLSNATDKCKNDQDCPKDKKCCTGPCNLECQTPQLDKPGKCKALDPNVQVRCSADATDKCKNDQDCPKDKKCCKDYCNLTCQSPVAKSKPGSCPKAPEGIITTCEVTCSDDSSCTGKQKCCKYGCSIKCMDPVKKVVKPGKCKALDPNVQVRCSADATDKCKNDQDCPKDKKCCKDYCNLTCQSPVAKSKSGSCPKAPEGIITTCDVKCSDDSSCTGKQKCCNYGCQIKCMDPVKKVVKPGKCRKITTKIACFKMGKDCKSDEDCDGDEKCCDGPCKLKCQKPDLKSSN